jgi:hypothetical protein
MLAAAGVVEEESVCVKEKVEGRGWGWGEDGEKGLGINSY